jgi:soluble lytic murein transglycosylase
VFIPALLFYGQQSNAESIKLRDLSRFIEESNSIAGIEIERRNTLKKIDDIITRYNESMKKVEREAISCEILAMSRKYPNLNVDFICATITHESAKTWDPRITSPVGALGLMQIMPTTGAFLATEEGIMWTSAEEILYDPIINIQLGCRYLSDLVGMYEKDGGLAAYNGGPRRAEMWLTSNRNNNILFAETRNYVPAVLKLYDEFRSQEQL